MVLIGGAFYFGQNRMNLDDLDVGKSSDQRQSVSPSPSATSSETANYPIALDNKQVTGAYARYFVTGKIKEIKANDTGSELVLEQMDGIPQLIIGQNTRVSRISLPYSAQTTVPIKVGDLAVGMVVDVSMEYDLKNKTWNTWDVYVPADRN